MTCLSIPAMLSPGNIPCSMKSCSTTDLNDSHEVNLPVCLSYQLSPLLSLAISICLLHSFLVLIFAIFGHSLLDAFFFIPRILIWYSFIHTKLISNWLFTLFDHHRRATMWSTPKQSGTIPRATPKSWPLRRATWSMLPTPATRNGGVSGTKHRETQYGWFPATCMLV